MSDIRWIMQEVPEEATRALLEGGFHPILAQLLAGRGYQDPDSARRFLEPRMEDLRPPGELPGIPETVERIRLALQRRETVLISGDYDVDGITSAALLVKVLRSAGLRVEARLPSRHDEGYGFHRSTVDEARALGVSLIITVDSGITAHDSVDYAREHGLDVVITDHHEPKETLPNAFAVVNPKRTDRPYSERELAGVGVAFTLTRALLDAGLTRHPLAEILELTALGTVADVVPLTGQNRIIVHFGLEALSETRTPGLQALKEIGRVSAGGAVTATDVGFRLGPRINAAGRMGIPDLAFQLLMCTDLEEARRIAGELDAANRQRQQIEEEIIREAMAAVEEQNPAGSYFLVVSGEGWHEGVIGIVASRLVERFHRPTAVIATHQGQGRGSARSIRGFHLLSSLDASSDLLDAHGGHEVAAGFSLPSDRIDPLRRRLEAYARQQMTEEDLERTLQVDSELHFRQIDRHILSGLEAMAPFGLGNPKPRFVSRDLRLKYPPRRVGSDGSHLRLVFQADGYIMDAVGFGLGDRAEELENGSNLQAVYVLEKNVWQGRERLQMQLKDLKIAP